MKLETYRSPDGRLRTDTYTAEDAKHFAIAEATASGTLVTEFEADGEVVNQVCVGTKDTRKALSDYLGGAAELRITDKASYERVTADAACTKCGSESIERLLDRQESGKITEVPVVPLFVCKKCGARFYSMSDSYLRRLMASSESLFEVDELAEKNTNEDKFVSTLQEYIIRIFASKKIQRLRTRGNK